MAKARFSRDDFKQASKVIDEIFQDEPDSPDPDEKVRIRSHRLIDLMRARGLTRALADAMIDRLVERGVFETAPGKVVLMHTESLSGEGWDEESFEWRYLITSMDRWDEFLGIKDGADKDTEGVLWKKTAERLKKLQQRGEEFISQRHLVELLDTRLSTINKALRSDPDLVTWAKTEKLPKSQSLHGIHTDNIAQTTEDDPADMLDYARTEKALALLIEESNPADAEQIKAMSADEQRELASWLDEDPDRGDKILGRRP